MMIYFSMNPGSDKQVAVRLKSHTAAEPLGEYKNVTEFLALEVPVLVNSFFLFLCPG